ncbi:MAG: hypothetical protein KKF68_02660 [Nanoarchaeota archaeon]|nr:hypothetical protein [Nanoarchaeota archaeon]
MKKKLLIFCFTLISIISLNCISADTNCTPELNCSEWGPCIGGEQIRDCADLNDCGEQSIETRTCNCVPLWQCTPWSECIEGIQIRSCIDFNTCANDSTKPLENKSCEETCIPEWECTDWFPEICPKNKAQTKNCTDLNNCGTIKAKPAETKSCEYKTDVKRYFTPLVIIIILIILIDLILIIELWKKKKVGTKITPVKKQSKIQKNPNIPPKK